MCWSCFADSVMREFRPFGADRLKRQMDAVEDRKAEELKHADSMRRKELLASMNSADSFVLNFEFADNKAAPDEDAAESSSDAEEANEVWRHHKRLPGTRRLGDGADGSSDSDDMAAVGRDGSGDDDEMQAYFGSVWSGWARVAAAPFCFPSSLLVCVSISVWFCVQNARQRLFATYKTLARRHSAQFDKPYKNTSDPLPKPAYSAKTAAKPAGLPRVGGRGSVLGALGVGAGAGAGAGAAAGAIKLETKAGMWENTEQDRKREKLLRSASKLGASELEIGKYEFVGTEIVFAAFSVHRNFTPPPPHTHTHIRFPFLHPQRKTTLRP